MAQSWDTGKPIARQEKAATLAMPCFPREAGPGWLLSAEQDASLPPSGKPPQNTKG